MFVFFWNAIWLLYQLIIHACYEVIFRKNISDFLCEASRQFYSCVQTRAAQTSRRLSNTFGQARFYRLLIWQWIVRTSVYHIWTCTFRVFFLLLAFFAIHTALPCSYFVMLWVFLTNFTRDFGILCTILLFPWFLLCLPLFF
jgi:hypothetical protein